MARDEMGSPSVDEDASQETSEKIKEEESSVNRVQEWWASGHGPASVAKNPILSAVDAGILAELISAGGSYHNILTTDRLDGLHRRLGNGTEPELENLRKALQTRGGAKAQARVVGMLLFKETRSLHLQVEAAGQVGSAFTAALDVAANTPVSNVTAPIATVPAQEETSLDEAWTIPRLYVCSESYPEGAQMAIRSAPNSKSSLVCTAPAGTEYWATGIVGEFLQVRIDIDGSQIIAYALHKIGSQVLLVPGTEQMASAEVGAKQNSVMLDEVFSLPRRYVCSESYPDGAQMAVRSNPNRESAQIATLPQGFEYIATGRRGDYLQIRLEINSETTIAYVTHTIGDLVLLIPKPDVVQSSQEKDETPATRAAAAAALAAQAATDIAKAEAATTLRVAALEAKVSEQDKMIQALRAELAAMRNQMSCVALAFRPLERPSSELTRGGA